MSTDDDRALGPKTPMRLGLVLLTLGGLTSMVWWASATSAKLDGILVNQAAGTIQLRELYADVTKLKSDVQVLQTVGSPAVRDLQAKMVEFEHVGSPALVPRIRQIEESLVKLQAAR